MNDDKWICNTCGTAYAEYVNGCPKCWDRGLRSKVVHYNDSTPFEALKGKKERG